MTDPLVSALNRLAELSAPPTLDAFMASAVVGAMVHPDTERMDWLCATYGLSRAAIDEAMK